VFAAIQRIAGYRFGPGARVDALRVVRAQRRRTFEPRQGAVEITFQPEAASHRKIDERIERVYVDALVSTASCKRNLCRDMSLWCRNAVWKCTKDKPA